MVAGKRAARLLSRAADGADKDGRPEGQSRQVQNGGTDGATERGLARRDLLSFLFEPVFGDS